MWPLNPSAFRHTHTLQFNHVTPPTAAICSLPNSRNTMGLHRINTHIKSHIAWSTINAWLYGWTNKGIGTYTHTNTYIQMHKSTHTEPENNWNSSVAPGLSKSRCREINTHMLGEEKEEVWRGRKWHNTRLTTCQSVDSIFIPFLKIMKWITCQSSCSDLFKPT